MILSFTFSCCVVVVLRSEDPGGVAPSAVPLAEGLCPPARTGLGCGCGWVCIVKCTRYTVKAFNRPLCRCRRRRRSIVRTDCCSSYLLLLLLLRGNAYVLKRFTGRKLQISLCALSALLLLLLRCKAAAMRWFCINGGCQAHCVHVNISFLGYVRYTTSTRSVMYNFSRPGTDLGGRGNHSQPVRMCRGTRGYGVW